jgi:hypothetical protein
VTAKIPFAVHDASYYSVTDLEVSSDGSLIVLSTIEKLMRGVRLPAGRSPGAGDRDRWEYIPGTPVDPAFQRAVGGNLAG